MNPTSELPRKIDPWPHQWDLHILNTCDFYFDEKDERTSLDFIRGASSSSCMVSVHTNEEEITSQNMVTGVEVRLLFRIFDADYGSILRYLGNKFVTGMVFYLVRSVIDINELSEDLDLPNNCQLIQSDHSLLLVQQVKGLKSNNAYKCIEIIDQIIREDYGKRGKGNDDSTPIIDPPDSPDDSLALDPTLIAA